MNWDQGKKHHVNSAEYFSERFYDGDDCQFREAEKKP